MNLCRSYSLAQEFTNNMEELQEKNIGYNDLGEDPSSVRYEAIQRLTDTYKNKQNTALIAGALLYFLSHPKKFITAQKYYSGDFGKPCEIR